MDTSRRQFLKATTLGGAAVSVLGFDLAAAYGQARQLKITRTTETRSTCPYCSVSCGVIIHTLGDRARNVTPTVVHVEGDPDHPINQGALCPKGITLKQNIVNDRRLTKVLYRRPGGRSWEEKSWEWPSTASPAWSSRRATSSSSPPMRAGVQSTRSRRSG